MPTVELITKPSCSVEELEYRPLNFLGQIKSCLPYFISGPLTDDDYGPTQKFAGRMKYDRLTIRSSELMLGRKETEPIIAEGFILYGVLPVCQLEGDNVFDCYIDYFKKEKQNG
jgi:hypothetical protein